MGCLLDRIQKKANCKLSFRSKSDRAGYKRTCDLDTFREKLGNFSEYVSADFMFGFTKCKFCCQYQV